MPKSPENPQILQCDKCASSSCRAHSGNIFCADCGHLILAGPKKTRHAKRGIRHRQDNGPEELEVSAVPPPTPQELGTAHIWTSDVLGGGSRALIAATHEAARLSDKFGEEIEAKWCLSTKWLHKLAETDRARARYALMWRPRFLAVVALTRSLLLASRAAKVSRTTVDKHRREDPDFDSQIVAAQEQAVDLLHDVTMREAIEGHCEPIYWQGIRCGSKLMVDNRLRIEMLRAHMPKTFKTPGTKGALIVGDGNQVLVVGKEEREELVNLRQEALAAMAQGRTPVPALVLDES